MSQPVGTPRSEFQPMQKAAPCEGLFQTDPASIEAVDTDSLRLPLYLPLANRSRAVGSRNYGKHLHTMNDRLLPSEQDRCGEPRRGDKTGAMAHRIHSTTKSGSDGDSNEGTAVREVQSIRA